MTAYCVNPRGFFNHFTERRTCLLLVIVFSLVVSEPFFSTDLMKGNDIAYHLMRMEGIRAGLLEGQFPVRINPIQLNGYGGLDSSLYPNLFLYIPAALMMCGMHTVTAYNILCILINISTALLAWWAFGKLTPSVRVAAAASIFYTGYMYRLINMYVRSALGECLAMVFLPAALVSLYLVLSGKTRYWPMIVVSWTGIFQSHIISAVLLVIAGVVVSVCHFRSFGRHDVRIAALKTVFFMIVLNAWFYVPWLYYYTTVDFSIKGRLHGIWMKTFTDIYGVQFFSGIAFLFPILAYLAFYNLQTVFSTGRRDRSEILLSLSFVGDAFNIGDGLPFSMEDYRRILSDGLHAVSVPASDVFGIFSVILPGAGDLSPV